MSHYRRRQFFREKAGHRFFWPSLAQKHLRNPFLHAFYLCQSKKSNVTPEFRGVDPLKMNIVCHQLYFKHHSEAQSCGEGQHRVMWRHTWVVLKIEQRQNLCHHMFKLLKLCGQFNTLSCGTSSALEKHLPTTLKSLFFQAPDKFSLELLICFISCSFHSF